MNKRTRVLHIISGLDTGGAEVMLLKLVRAHQECGMLSKIISLREEGPIARSIKAIGVEVISLGIKPARLPSFGQLLKLVREARVFHADVVQGWMYHGNLAALFVSFLKLPRPPLYWNIRQTLAPPGTEKRLTRLAIRANSWASSIPKAILYNSRSSAEQHEGAGFNKEARVIIGNGFDLDRYNPINKAGEKSVRAEFDLPENAILVGHIARFHNKKDHKNFFLAAIRILKVNPNIIFIAAGKGVARQNPDLTTQIRQSGVVGNIYLLGERQDVARLMAAFDVFVSSSAWGEGFPNTIGEAMASGVPCVVTDVGESAYIVGCTGKVVPPNDPVSLASGIMEILKFQDLVRKNMGLMGRERIMKYFSINKIAGEYAKIYRSGLRYGV